MRITILELAKFHRARGLSWLLPVLCSFLVLECLLALGRGLRMRIARLRTLPSASVPSETTDPRLAAR